MGNYSTLNKGCIYDYDTLLKYNVAWLDTAIFYDDGTLHRHWSCYNGIVIKKQLCHQTQQKM